MHAVLVAVRHLAVFVCVVRGGRGQRPGDSWDVRQVGRGASQRRRPALHEELPVVDNPGPCSTRDASNQLLFNCNSCHIVVIKWVKSVDRNVLQKSSDTFLTYAFQIEVIRFLNMYILATFSSKMTVNHWSGFGLSPNTIKKQV